MTFMYFIALITIWLPIWLLFPAKILGCKKLPDRKKRLIITCNHRAAGDPFFVGKHYPGRQLFFPAKKELFKNRFVAAILRGLGAIPVSRGDTDLGAIRALTNALKEEKTVCIFPEGTRNHTDAELLTLKNGAALFSLKTGAPIVPIYMAHKQRFLRRNYIYVGEPFYLTEFEGERLNKEVLDKASLVIAHRILDAKSKLDEYFAEKQSKRNRRRNKPKVKPTTDRGAL